MSDDLIFYTNPMSRGRVVRWMLEEIGADYQTEVVFYGEAMQSAGYRAVNPMAKVPALRHGAATITETAAICAYLADVFPEAGLAPQSGQRSAYYRWLFFGAGPVEAAITNKACGFEITPQQSQTAGYGSLERVLDALEGRINDAPYMAGDSFSAADVYIGGQLNFGLMFGTVEKRAAFEAYVAKVTDRAAFRRANEIDDALMPSET